MRHSSGSCGLGPSWHSHSKAGSISSLSYVVDPEGSGGCWAYAVGSRDKESSFNSLQRRQKWPMSLSVLGSCRWSLFQSWATCWGLYRLATYQTGQAGSKGETETDSEGMTVPKAQTLTNHLISNLIFPRNPRIFIKSPGIPATLETDPKSEFINNTCL